MDKYPAEYMELERKLSAYEEQARGDEYNRRRNLNDAIRKHQKGMHWPESSDKPSIQLSWWASEMFLPKVFVGHSFEPEVIPGSTKEINIQGTGLEQALQQNQQVLSGKNVQEQSAEMRTAILDHWWEKVKVHKKIKEAGQDACWHGDTFILTSRDEKGPKVDIVCQEDVLVDPEATSLADARYCAYLVPRTLHYIKDKYPKYADRISGENDNSSEAHDDPTDADNNIYPLECWFVKDHTKKTFREEVDVRNDQDLAKYQKQGWLVDEKKTEYVQQPYQTLDGDVQYTTAPAQWTVYRDKKEFKYRGGWRKVVRCSGVILDDSDNPAASGNLPLIHLKFFNVPGEFYGMGLVEQIKPLVTQLDEMVHEGSEVVRNLKPFLLALGGRIQTQDAQTLGSKLQMPIVTMKPNADISDLRSSLQHIPGAELQQSFIAIMNLYLDWIQLISGAFDLRQAGNIPQDSSGKFVEAVEGAGNARVSMVRDNIREAVELVAENILADELEYGDGEQTYRSTRGIDKGYYSANPQDLRDVGDNDDPEFEILVGGTDALPQNPIDRNAYLEGLIDRLAQKPLVLALAELELLELPNKEAVKAALEQFHKSQQEQKAQGQGVDPEAKKRYAEGISDVLEELAKKSVEKNPAATIVVLEQLQSLEKGGELDLNKVAGVTRPLEVEMPQLQPAARGAA